MGCSKGLSVGIDLVSVPRMEGLMARWGGRFLERVFTPGEIEYCKARHAPARSFAARFAAKEAFVKAVSHTSRGGIRYKDVEVVVGAGGIPTLVSHGKARSALGRGYAEISLSHEDDLAIAIVIACAEVTG
jgi:holo-[acyl-carrier protein] synthase